MTALLAAQPQQQEAIQPTSPINSENSNSNTNVNKNENENENENNINDNETDAAEEAVAEEVVAEEAAAEEEAEEVVAVRPLSPIDFPTRSLYHLYNHIQVPWNLLVVDVRSHKEYRQSHIINAANLPLPLPLPTDDVDVDGNNGCHLSDQQKSEILCAFQQKRSKGWKKGLCVWLVCSATQMSEMGVFVTELQKLRALIHKCIDAGTDVCLLDVPYEEWHRKCFFFNKSRVEEEAEDQKMNSSNNNNSDNNSNNNNNSNNESKETDEQKEEQEDEDEQQQPQAQPSAAAAAAAANTAMFDTLISLAQRNIQMYRRYPNSI